MGVRDAVEVVADNAREFVKNPAAQGRRALGVVVDSIKSDGAVGAAAKSISGRGAQIDDAVDAAEGAKQNIHSPYTGRPHDRTDGD